MSVRGVSMGLLGLDDMVGTKTKERAVVIQDIVVPSRIQKL